MYYKHTQKQLDSALLLSFFLDAKKQESQFQAQIQQGKLRLTHMKKELSESMPKAKRAEKEHASLISEMERTKNDVERLQVNTGNPSHRNNKNTHSPSFKANTRIN